MTCPNLKKPAVSPAIALQSFQLIEAKDKWHWFSQAHRAVVMNCRLDCFLLLLVAARGNAAESFNTSSGKSSSAQPGCGIGIVNAVIAGCPRTMPKIPIMFGNLIASSVWITRANERWRKKATARCLRRNRHSISRLRDHANRNKKRFLACSRFFLQTWRANGSANESSRCPVRQKQ